MYFLNFQKRVFKADAIVRAVQDFWNFNQLAWILLTVAYIVWTHAFIFLLTSILFLFSEKNNLSFIETSALDSTNVETAFQNILTGK